MKTGSKYSTATLLSFLFFFFYGFVPVTSFAQLMGKYEFTGVSTIETQNNFSDVTTQPYYATFSPFRRDIVQWWRGDNVYNSREWGKTIAEERFIEFTITAKPDYALLITSLSFDNFRTANGPTNIRIAHNASGSFNTVSPEFFPADSKITETVWDFADITTPVGGSVTFRIYGYGATSYLGAFRVDNVSLFGTPLPQVKVNEFHYANTAVTQTGFIEVVVPKDFTNLNSVQIALYNGAGGVYSTFSLANFKTPALGIVTTEKIYYLDVPSGLADNQGGICIYSGNYIIQFLSYGGSLVAVSGPAAGQKSQDVGITEKASDGPDNSLYLALKNNANYAPGTWGRGLANSNTKGFPNDDYAVLPVELMYFKAQATAREVKLSWATAVEKNNEEFVVERSQDEVLNFKSIGVIKGNGNSNSEKQYRFADTKPLAGTSYYRLKQIDFDGTINYSPVIAIKTEVATTTLTVYPNPTTDLLNIDLGQQKADKEISLRLVNTLGKIIFEQTYAKLTQNTLSVPVNGLPAGTYYLVLVKDGMPQSKTFVKR